MDLPDEIIVRSVAEYQIMCDGDPREIMTERLQAGVDEGDLAAFEITAIHPGIFGIGLVMFTADAAIPRMSTSDDAKDLFTALLNRLIHDTDVDVRWVTPLAPSNEEPLSDVEKHNLACGQRLEDKQCVGCLTVLGDEACPNVANDLASPLCTSCCGESH